MGTHIDVINALTRAGTLDVINRAAVIQYIPGSRPEFAEAAANLNVSSLLVGTIRQDGEDLRVAVELVGPATDRNIWADNYDAEFRDFFAITADIAMNVANELNAELSAGARTRTGDLPQISFDAYRLYVRSLATKSPEDAHALLDEVITLWPGYATAHARQHWVACTSSIGACPKRSKRSTVQ